MNKKEIWKDIPGYEGLYQASTEGRIRSVDRQVIDKNGSFKNYKGRVLKYSTDSSNRLQVGLTKDGIGKTINIHRLMALTFMKERPEGYDICHLNGDCQDNRLENLRYDTRSQNMIDMYRQGRKAPVGKLSIDEVLEIRKLYATGDYYQKELAEMFGVAQFQIGSIVNYKTFSWLNDDGSIDDSDMAVS